MRRPLAAIVLLAASLAAPAAGPEQDFYQIRLRSGEDALRANRPQDAVAELRIAAFGFLERPVLLSEALAALALAEDRAGRVEDVQRTLSRFIQVERRFAPYRQSGLAPELRADFDRLLRRRTSASALNSLPAFATVAPIREPAPAQPTTAAQIAGQAGPTPTPPAEGVAPPPSNSARGASPGPARPPAAASAPPPVEPVSATDGTTADNERVDQAPRIKTLVRPTYPVAAARAGVGGVVLLRVLISETGAPLQVEVIRGVRADLAQAAIAAVSRWTFEPGRRGNRSVQAWTSIAIPFKP